MKISRTRILVECAIMIAIATVLSMIKIVDLPYGGSITIASMLPMIIIAYRHGLAWGLGTGLVYGVIQQLTGLSSLSYVTTWQSIVAVVLLDYIIAFTVTGFGGVFRKSIPNPGTSLAAGALLVCVLRYICHVISGATVWAGLSIPTSAALAYSLAYNATYMLPEAIVTVIAAYYIGSVLDFRREQPVRLEKSDSVGNSTGKWIAGLFLSGALIFDVASVFSKLQNAQTGDFDITGLSQVSWGLVAGITAAAIVVAVVGFVCTRRLKEKSKK